MVGHGEIQCEVRQGFGCKHLDKMPYGDGAKVHNLGRVGVVVRTEGPGTAQYVTDHLGLTG